ncbi:hypothetical protein J437_LFUL010358 [Ladona fulva]|uniref:Uncharacterized protein n=1 Tax=Ladona fulva TaxID=123851 RepID=A0A8K0P1E6_LADFU|nr:hypothetical protein J437_LFUL010358 [Ladona fulva]
MSSTLGVRHQQTRWFPAPLGRLGAGPVAVEAAAGVIQGSEDRLEVSKMASRENGGEFGVAFVGEVEEDEEDEECSDVGREDREGVVRRTFRFVLPESPTDDGDGGEEDEEGCWSEERSPRVGRSVAASFVSEDDGAKPEGKEGDDAPSARRPRRPCSVVLDPIPCDLLRSLSSVGKNNSERASLRSTPPPLADCDEPPRPLPPLHPQPKARPIAVVDPSCEGPRRRLSAPAIAGGPPTPPGGAAPLMAGAPLRHRRCSCHGAGAHGARSPRPAIDPPTLPPRRHGGAWASRDVMTTSDPDVEVLVVAEEEARGGGKECREEGVREERSSVGEEEEVRRTLRKRAKRRRRRREEDEEGGRSSGEAEREIRSVERNNYRKRSCSSSTTASSSTASSTSTVFSTRRRHKHRKRRRRRVRPLESEEEAAPVTSEVSGEPCNANPTPRVNPIFVWAKQDDAATILEVLCEDYDKRNRIRLTKTANGWRAIPRTERLAAATATSSVGQPAKEAPAAESPTASNVEGPPDPSVLLRLPLATTVTPPPRRRSRGDAEKSKKESRKGAKAIPRVAASSDEKKPREDHLDSPGQPETYGGEGPGRPETNDEKSSATSVVPEGASAASKPRQVKPRDQRLVNKRVRKAPVKRAKPRKKPAVKKAPTLPTVLPDNPPVEEVSEISKENEDIPEANEEGTPKREPVKKATPRSRRKNSRVVRTNARSRARVSNARRIKAKKGNVVSSSPLKSPSKAVEEEKIGEKTEEMKKDMEEIAKEECHEQPETEEIEEMSVKEGENTECELAEEVPSEQAAEPVEENNAETLVVEGEGEEDAANGEDASDEVQESEAVSREDVEEIMDGEDAEAVVDESSTIAEGVEDEGVEEDAESHAEAVMEEENEEVEAVADNEEMNGAEMLPEENPEGEEGVEGVDGAAIEGEVEGEILEEVGNEEGTNEEEGEVEVAPEAEIEEGETTIVEEGEVLGSEEGEAQVEEGEAQVEEGEAQVEEGEAQVEEGEGEEEAHVGEEEEAEVGEAVEDEEAEDEDDEDDDEDEDEEEDDEEDEESLPKTPPPAHAASHPASLVPQAAEGEGQQEEPADLSIRKRKTDEVDEPPPFKKVRRSHVTGLLPSTRITTCPRSLLPLKEAPPPINSDPSVPAPAHSSEPYQPIAPTMNDDRVMGSKTPQKDPLDLVFPPSEESTKMEEISQKEQWKKVSSSEGSSRDNSEEKADSNSNLVENLTLEPPLKKIKVEIEEEEEPATEMMEPNVEDSHQITLKKLLSSKEASHNLGLSTSVDIVVPKPKVELAFPADVSDASKSCARSRLLELLTSPDAHKSSPSPSRSTPMQRTPSPATPTVTSRPYSHPPPAVKIEPRTEEADGGCEEGKAGLELKKLKDLLGRQSTAKLALKQVALENPAPLALKQVGNPPETTITRLPTPERQPSEPLPSQRTPPIITRADTVRVPQPSIRNNNKSKTSHQSFPHNRTASRGSSGREANASSRGDGAGSTEQDVATAAAAAALHNMLWLPYLGQLEMAVNTGNRELLASLGNAMFGPPPPISPSSQSSTSPRALSHFPTPPPPQNPPFVHGNPFLQPTSLPPSAIADYKSRVELSQTLNLWQDIMAANASSAFNSSHQDLLNQESLERNGGTNGLVVCQRQDGSVNSHLQERQSPRFPHNGRKPSPASTPLSPSHSPSADFLRYMNSGAFSGSANSMPRPQIPQNNNQFNVCYNGVHNGNPVHNSNKHSYNDQKAHPLRHPTPSQIYRNIETNSNQLQQTLSLASVSRPRKSPSTSAADSTQSKNSSRRQPLSSPRDESVKIPTSSSMSNASQRQKSGLTCRSLLNLLSNPQTDGAELIATDNMGDESTRMDQQRHGHLLAALARPSSTQSDKRAISMSRFPPMPSSMCPQVIGLDPESEYLQAARFSTPLSGVGQTLLPAGVQPMDLSGRSGGKSTKREERAAEMEAFRSQEVAATLNSASGSAHPHLWHPLFGRKPMWQIIVYFVSFVQIFYPVFYEP